MNYDINYDDGMSSLVHFLLAKLCRLELRAGIFSSGFLVWMLYSSFNGVYCFDGQGPQAVPVDCQAIFAL